MLPFKEYKVWMALPLDIRVDLVAPGDVVMHGPSPERVSDDPFQKDPRILPAFNEYSASGDVTADVVYANYGRLEDFKKLQVGLMLRARSSSSVMARISAGETVSRSAVRSGRRHHLLRPLGRWVFQRRSVSQGTLAPGDRSTARIGAVCFLPLGTRRLQA